MKRVLKWGALGLLAITVVLCGVVLARTFLAASPQLPAEGGAALAIDQQAVAERLAAALRIPTISHQDPAQTDVQQFERLFAYMEEAFPRVHETLARERVGAFSLLYKWPGTDAGAEPVLLLAHMDVVPAPRETLDRWEHPPFEGAIADGYIWGRGAVDDKSSVFGILEAAEALLAEGFTPNGTLYFCFGGDEEVGGLRGAKKIADLLQQRGITAAFSLDEGMAVTDGIIPGLPQPLALIGLAEKGYLTLKLASTGEAGHSSAPPDETAIGMLARAVARLEDNPFPADLRGPIRDMFTYIAPEMAFPLNLVFCNLWLFEPLVQAQLEAMPDTNAALRTTTAPTVFHAGTKENVLPGRATALVNFRLMPGDTIEEVTERVREIIGDERITLEPGENINEPSRVAGQDEIGYVATAKSIRSIWPGVLVAPGMTLGGTDSPNYEAVARHQYRFSPLWFTSEDLKMVHGVNERIRVGRYAEAIQFFAAFMRNIWRPVDASGYFIKE